MKLYDKGEMNYKNLFNLCWEHSDNLLLLLNDELIIQRINSTAEKLLGWEPSEVLNKNISIIFQEHSIQPFIIKNTTIDENSTFLFCNDKKLKITWTILPIYDDKNKMDLIFIIGKKEIQPIDEQLEMVQLENVVKFAPGFLYWKNNDSVYQGCNDEFARLAGLKNRAEVKGKTDFDLIWKDGAELYVEIDKGVVESGVARLDHVEIIAVSNSKTITAITNKVPMRDSNGNVIGILGITTDITHQKEVELALNAAKELAEVANQAKSDFIANMSHDIRTPLSGIVGMSKLLEESALSSQERQYAQWVNESGNQLLELLNGVLDVISADTVREDDLNEKTFDLYKTIQSIKQLELPAIQTKQIEFKIEINEQVPRYVVSDKTKFHRILLNLLGNAIKFTNKGYVMIAVKPLGFNENSVQLEIRVEDTGIGIPDDVLAHLFDRFFRVNPSYKGIYRGHGLGLHIAQKYASLLKGDITVQSQVGKGTQFYFTLWLKLGDTPENVVELNKISVPHAPSQAKKPANILHDMADDATQPHLLLVEDNAIALRLLETLCTQYGCRFTSAVDGEQAFDLVKSTAFDLIVTDFGLPGISGVELTYAIREWETSLNKPATAIIGLTAHGLQEAGSPGMRAGMNKILQKPIRPETMQMLIEEFINLKDPIIENAPIGLGLDLPNTEAQLFQLEAYPLLDTVNGIQCLGSEAVLKELLSQMINEFPKDEIALKEAYSEKDWILIEKIAHKIKGGAVYCGTIKLKYACQYVERYQKAGHTRQLNKLYLQLLHVIAETKGAIGDWLGIP
jgi:PAS domain S-box-containing protein